MVTAALKNEWKYIYLCCKNYVDVLLLGKIVLGIVFAYKNKQGTGRSRIRYRKVPPTL